MLQVSPVSPQRVFSLEGFWYFLVSPFAFTPTLPSSCPQILCQTILNQVTSFLCVYAHVPVLCFHWAAFHGRQGFLILGSRQRWQNQAGQSQSERGSQAAIQPSRQAVSQSLQWSPSSSPEEPIIQERYQTMNHLRQSSPPLPSPTLACSLDARPAACLPLSASLMNDYCIS